MCRAAAGSIRRFYFGGGGEAEREKFSPTGSASQAGRSQTRPTRQGGGRAGEKSRPRSESCRPLIGRIQPPGSVRGHCCALIGRIRPVRRPLIGRIQPPWVGARQGENATPATPTKFEDSARAAKGGTRNSVARSVEFPALCPRLGWSARKRGAHPCVFVLPAPGPAGGDIHGRSARPRCAVPPLQEIIAVLGVTVGQPRPVARRSLSLPPWRIQGASLLASATTTGAYINYARCCLAAAWHNPLGGTATRGQSAAAAALSWRRQ